MTNENQTNYCEFTKDTVFCNGNCAECGNNPENQKDKINSSKLLNVKELRDDIKLDIGDRLCDYDDGYICDVITEIADNDVDIYYSDLFEWCKRNYSYVEDAVSEGLVDTSNFDIIKAIQCGQFYYNEQIFYNELDEAVLNYCYDYVLRALKIEYITDEQNDAIIEKCTSVDNNDRLDDFNEFLDELLNPENDGE